MPCQDPLDPDYRRLRYIRYADDFLLGLIGSYADAVEIKYLVGTWLCDHLKLELSRDKTLITHATSGAAHFLGYEIRTQRVDDKLDRRKRRATNGKISLRVSPAIIDEHIARFTRHGKPHHRVELVNDSDFAIVNLYQQEFRESSSTTCWRSTSHGSHAYAGSWRYRCSRPWHASTLSR